MSDDGQAEPADGQKSAPKLHQQFPPDATRVAKAWEYLPPAIRRAIIALVDAADTDTGRASGIHDNGSVENDRLSD